MTGRAVLRLVMVSTCTLPRTPGSIITTTIFIVTFGAFGLGACGVTNTDADYVVAISYLIFDNYPWVPSGRFLQLFSNAHTFVS